MQSKYEVIPEVVQQSATAKPDQICQELVAFSPGLPCRGSWRSLRINESWSNDNQTMIKRWSHLNSCPFINSCFRPHHRHHWFQDVAAKDFHSQPCFTSFQWPTDPISPGSYCRAGAWTSVWHQTPTYTNYHRFSMITLSQCGKPS